MRFAVPAQEVVTSDNIGQTTSFRVDDMGKVAWILANMYPDGMLAMIRELCCNALDAHLINKSDRPFIITLPTTLSPQWTLLDFGPGLSREFMTKRYTAFGSSTKDGSVANTAVDKLTGGFGIGRLAAFAYPGLDMYTVESFHAGEKTTWSVFLSEAGIPSITLLHAEPSDQTGFRITIPVRPGDFDSVRSKTVDLLRSFPPGSAEVFHLERPLNIQPHGYLMEGDGYAFYQDRWRRTGVRMAPIIYGLDWAQVFPKKIIEASRHLYPLQGLELRVELGQIDIMPNRDGVMYTPRTVEYLQQAHARMLKSVQGNLAEEVEAQPTLWKAREVFDAARAAVHGTPAEDIMPRSLSWRGEQVDGRRMKAPNGKFQFFNTESLNNINPRGKEVDDFRVGASAPSPVIVYDDITSGKTKHSAERMRIIQKKTDSKTLLLFRPHNGTFDEVMKRLGNPPDDKVFKLSDIEMKRSPVKRVKRTTGSLAAYYFSPGNNVGRQDTLHLGRGGVYVQTSTTSPDDTLTRQLLAVSPIGVTGLTKRAMSEIDMTNFQPLQEYLVEWARKYLKVCAVESAISPLEWLAVDAQYSPPTDYLNLAINTPASFPDPVWQSAAKVLQRIHAVRQTKFYHQDLLRLRALINLGLLPEVKISDFPAWAPLVEDTNKKRPLFALLMEGIRAVNKENAPLILKSLGVKANAKSKSQSQ